MLDGDAAAGPLGILAAEVQAKRRARCRDQCEAEGDGRLHPRYLVKYGKEDEEEASRRGSRAEIMARVAKFIRGDDNHIIWVNNERRKCNA